MGELTPKQQKFVEAYAGNATEAARIAGYKSPEVEGHRLLRNAKIDRAIKDREKEPRKLRIATREERQKFWTDVMLDAEQRMNDRLKAAELLGKSNADFSEKIINSGEVIQRIIFERESKNHES
jgi:phage terminase small subunit